MFEIKISSHSLYVYFSYHDMLFYSHKKQVRNFLFQNNVDFRNRVKKGSEHSDALDDLVTFVQFKKHEKHP